MEKSKGLPQIHHKLLRFTTVTLGSVSINPLRDRVNSFTSEKSWVPECVLLLEWLHKSRAPDRLEYKVKLLGTGEENDQTETKASQPLFSKDCLLCRYDCL